MEIFSYKMKDNDASRICNTHETDDKCICIFILVHKIAKSDYQLLHVCPSAWDKSSPTARIFMKIDIFVFVKYLSRKFKFNSNMTRPMYI